MRRQKPYAARAAASAMAPFMRLASLPIAILASGAALLGPVTGHAMERWHLDPLRTPPPGDSRPAAAGEGGSAGILALDLFATSPEQVKGLRAQGFTVLCRLDAGRWESERPDAHAFPRAALGRSLADTPDRRWLDIRDPSLRPLLDGRLELCSSRGFTGVVLEGLDVDGQASGFAIGLDDRLAYARWLAGAAHRRDLLAGVRGASDRAAALAEAADFVVAEACDDREDGCADMGAPSDAERPASAAEKPVYRLTHNDAAWQLSRQCTLEGERGRGRRDCYGAVYGLEPLACVLGSLGRMAREVGTGAEIGAGYLSPSYVGYDARVEIPGRGSTYVRHTGRDFRMGIGGRVHALVAGHVTAILGRHAPAKDQAVVIDDGDGIHWIYGHIRIGLQVGQVVGRGQVVGTIADPQGEFRPHAHIGAYKVPLPNDDAAFRANMGWGRAYGDTEAEAEANALRYTIDPLEAYAAARGRRGEAASGRPCS